MSFTLLQSLKEADGRYLNDNELLAFEQYQTSFKIRLETYQLLGQNSEAYILQTLRNLVRTHKKTIQDHGHKCKRDMDYTLRSIAKAVLLNDRVGFQEEFLLWMQNITRALHKEESAVQGYQLLKQVIAESMPATHAALVNGYLDELIQAFSTLG